MKNLNEKIAFHATQYLYRCNPNSAIRKSIQDLILEDLILENGLSDWDTSYLIGVFNNYLIESNRGDDYIYDNDEYFFDEFFTSPMEAVRATFYGDYRYRDDYVQFNGYGNLNSYQEHELRRLIQEDSDFLDYIYECQFNPSDYGINLNEIKEILENLLEAGL